MHKRSLYKSKQIKAALLCQSKHPPFSEHCFLLDVQCLHLLIFTHVCLKWLWNYWRCLIYVILFSVSRFAYMCNFGCCQFSPLDKIILIKIGLQVWCFTCLIFTYLYLSNVIGFRPKKKSLLTSCGDFLANLLWTNLWEFHSQLEPFIGRNQHLKRAHILPGNSFLKEVNVLSFLRCNSISQQLVSEFSQLFLV